MLKVNEIFYSIQGEGQKTGYPCVFLRLFGCNMRCKWCDTKYALEPSKDFKKMKIDQVIKEIKKYGVKYVCITGGEPLLQEKEVETLIISMPGFTFEINTNGSLPINVPFWIKKDRVRYVVDYKLPSSGMWGRFLWKNVEFLDEKDDIVMVIKNREDYKIARETSKAIKEISSANIIFSPCWGDMSKQKLVKWILEDKLNARLGLQIHKVIYGPIRRGV